MIGHLRELAIGLHHQRHTRGLHRDLHQIEVDLSEIGQLALGRLDHGLGRRPTVALVEIGIEGSGVHPDTDRHRTIAALRRHRLDVLGFADIARIETQTLHTGLERRQRHAVLVMDVGHDRHRGTRHDLRETLSGLRLIAGAANDVATRRREGVDLLEGALDVGGLGDRHRLNAHRRPTTDRHRPHQDLAGRATLSAPLGHIHDDSDRPINRPVSRCRGRAPTRTGTTTPSPPPSSTASTSRHRRDSGDHPARAPARRSPPGRDHRRGATAGTC